MFGVFLALCGTGAGFLVASIPPLLSTISLLRHQKMRCTWCGLGYLIAAFIAGYLALIWLRWDADLARSDLLVAAIFCAGGLFVFGVTNLSSKTVAAVQRLALAEREAILDPLTGLYNRRYLMPRLESELVAARRHRLPLSLLMIDVDHFKHINDTEGHGCGDGVLREIGRIVEQNRRSGDVVVRYGGDEVLVLAANTDLAAAESFAERLRGAIATADFGTGRKITVSIGVASLADGTPGTLLAWADEALYAAKRDGRNRVSVTRQVRDRCAPGGAAAREPVSCAPEV